MKSRVLVWAVRVALSSALLVGAPAGHAADLLQIYRDAQQNDPVVAAARSAYEAAKERLPQAEAGLRPSVTLSGAVEAADNVIDTRPDSPCGPGTCSRTTGAAAKLQAVHPLYNPVNSVLRNQAKVAVVQAETSYQQIQQDLVIRVSQAYFDVLLAQDNVAFTAAQKAAVSEQLAQAKRNFEVGTATITDTNEAQAKYDQVVAQEIAAQNELESKRRALQSIIGRVETELTPLTGKAELGLLETGDMESWVRRADDSNYSVKVAQLAYDIASYEAERAKAAKKPTVNLTGSLSDDFKQQHRYGADTNTRNAYIGISVSVPLYTGGLLESKVREAESGKEKARNDLETAKRSAQLGVRQAYLGVTSGAAQVKALQQALVSSETALASSKLGQEVGVRTNVDVLNAQQQVVQVKRDLAKARYDYILNSMRLKAAAGALKLEDIESVNRALAAKG